MQRFASRVGRWPLALTMAALAACSDDPASPNLVPVTGPNATLADPFTVVNTNDDGIGSLRWVLKYTTGGETIRFDPTLDGQTITLASRLVIEKPVTIEAPSRKGITLDAGGNGRVMYIPALGTTTLRNLSLTGGDVGTESVGAVYATDSLTTLVLENSTVYGNSSNGGIAILGGNITLVNSTVSGNPSTGGTPTEFGALMGFHVTLINSTVASNGASGAIALRRLTLRNSILSNNLGYNCVLRNTATLTREGTNISDDDRCGSPTEITIADPKLDTLADNSGPSWTHALLTGSPAINAGTNCTVSDDQRHVPRDAHCDLGAYEFTGFTTVTLTIDPATSVNQANGWAVVTGTITCSRNETFSLAVQLEQQQKSGKSTSTVDAAAMVPVECTTSVRPWIASMILTSGAFTTGAADAKAQTFDAPKWVTPASAASRVKMFYARRSN